MFQDESWKLIYLFLGQNINGQDHESQIHCWRGSLHSCKCWLFLVRRFVSLIANCIH